MESDGVFWERFRKFLCKEYCSNYAQDNFRYAKQFYKCLLNNDLAILKTLSTNKRLHVMNALSALSKFVGIYDRFRMLIKAFGLKWSVNTDDVIIARLLRYSGNGRAVENKLVEWIKAVKREIPEYAVFMDFIVATGLRFDEALNSYNLIIELTEKGKIDEYYNPERQMLEHFRFRNLFVRRTKKAFMSFICADLVKHAAEGTPLTRDVIVKRLQRKRVELHFGDIREFFATYSTKHLRQPEIDFLQGRTSATVFMRNYFNPTWISDLEERTLKNADEMLKLTTID